MALSIAADNCHRSDGGMSSESHFGNRFFLPIYSSGCLWLSGRQQLLFDGIFVHSARSDSLNVDFVWRSIKFTCIVHNVDLFIAMFGKCQSNKIIIKKK